MSLSNALAAVVASVNTAINAAGVANKVTVFAGYPTSTEMAQVLGQTAAQAQVSVYPLPGATNASRYRPTFTPVGAVPASPLVATISQNTVTFTGTVTANLNVHLFVDPTKADAHYQTVVGDTPASVATALASAVNALALPGVSASASGAAVTALPSTSILACNIGQANVVSAIAAEVGRIAQKFQVSIWSNDATLRMTLHDAIVANVGTVIQAFLTMADGSGLWCRFGTYKFIDTSSSSYSLYEDHIVFACEYGVTQTSLATQIESVAISQSLNSVASATAYSPG